MARQKTSSELRNSQTKAQQISKLRLEKHDHKVKIATSKEAIDAINQKLKNLVKR